MPTDDEMEKRAMKFIRKHDHVPFKDPCQTCMCEFARSEIARLDQEAYLNSKIEAATETWKGVDTDEFMNELRQSDDDKAREEARGAAWDARSTALKELNHDGQITGVEIDAFDHGWNKGVAFAEPRWTAVKDGLPEVDGQYLVKEEAWDGGTKYEAYLVSNFRNRRFDEVFAVMWCEIPKEAK